MSTKFITVSIEILQDKNLTANEKFILAEIAQLSTLTDGCYASNKHFESLLSIPKNSVSRSINSLVEKGYILSEIKMGSRNRVRILKMSTGCKQKGERVSTKCVESKENKQDNIHRIDKEEEEVGKNQDLLEQVERENQVGFVNLLRSMFMMIPIPVDGIDYYFANDGYLRVNANDRKVAAGRAADIYKRMYKVRVQLTNGLWNKKCNVIKKRS